MERKTSSTNYSNELSMNKCPVSFTLSLIGGRWKPLILWQLTSGTKRYNELRKGLPAISEKMLIQKLKELEVDGLVLRKSKPVVPPHVVYDLSERGKTLHPILQSLANWGLENV